MSSIFISMAEQAYGASEIVGVNTTKSVAEQKCRDTPFADEEKTMRYDRFWIEEWIIGGPYVRTYHLIEEEFMEVV